MPVPNSRGGPNSRGRPAIGGIRAAAAVAAAGKPQCTLPSRGGSVAIEARASSSAFLAAKALETVSAPNSRIDEAGIRRPLLDAVRMIASPASVTATRTVGR
ncbi:MAG: hypothetical protein BWX47_01271 [candidate division Hyd24-12 bacterium ADurb.Bin004]|nr:MAG: hypothetical protein BWX47_01271 [candidate division Hyd24-12 bacterium ADurb.Bin004]